MFEGNLQVVLADVELLGRDSDCILYVRTNTLDGMSRKSPLGL